MATLMLDVPDDIRLAVLEHIASLELGDTGDANAVALTIDAQNETLRGMRERRLALQRFCNQPLVLPHTAAPCLVRVEALQTDPPHRF